MLKTMLAGAFVASFALSMAGVGRAADTWQSPPPPAVKAQDFNGTVDGKPVALYTIRNKNGLSAAITNYGAKLVQLIVPDRDGVMSDIIQGYESLDKAMTGQASMNAFIGRFANRLGGGVLKLDGTEYQLAVNDGGGRKNTLHGGEKGSRFLPFDAKQLSDNSVQMTLLFKDGEEGFPGDLPLRVVYTLTDNDEFVIEYDAVSANKTTVANFTGHAFFNLSGDLGSSIEDHVITMNADKVLEVSDMLTPNGKLRDVTGTPMDFRNAKPLSRDIGADYDLLKGGNGYDNHYAVNQKAEGEMTFHARARDPKSGRILEVWSTEPGCQLYTGNFLEGKDPRDVGKGYVFKFRSGFCLEPSHFPDAPNHANFKSIILKPGEWYNGKIVYKFSAK